MPSKRGSYPAPLPYHQRTLSSSSSSKLYKSNKPSGGWKRPLRWFLLIGTIMYIVLYILFPSSTPSQPQDHFAELVIAQQLHPSPPTTASIPKIVHFVYGLKGPDPTLDWIHYLSIKSAHDRLSPTTIMFHYHYLPTGPVFDLARPMLTLHKVDLAPTTAPFGDRPVTHFAHQADLIRLDVLNHYGGIYLDLDVIVMRSMDHLLHHEFIMGQEGIGGSVGLCNAVIIARPQARFLQRWQHTYRTFDQADWNYHSVVLPGKLARHFSGEITIMNHTAFFWPLWDSHGLRTLFLEKNYDFADNLATHVWESAATPHLMAGLTPSLIRNIDSSLYCQLRHLLPHDDQEPIRPCRVLTHSPRSDHLVGSWPLAPVPLTLNPFPAADTSGNDMHGILRNGFFLPNDDDGVYLSGQDSYLFLSMPTNLTLTPLTIQWHTKITTQPPVNDQGTVMMVQTDVCKLWIKPGAVETWTLTNGWVWERTSSVPLSFPADNQYHVYTLVLHSPLSSSLLTPALVVYRDGYVVASSQAPTFENGIVRGVWFGSAEPAKYQDPWDTSASLAAWYKTINIWERALTLQDLRNDPLQSFKNADHQSWLLE